MSRFVNDEGHEGTRSKMLLRLIDGLLSCVALSVVLSVIALQPALAGGPRYVAGVSYFDPSTKGTPLTWSQGIINYYTDQGDLSPLLPGANADSFVADAFSRWTSVPTAALSSTLAGHLAEDVNGTNVSVTNGVVTMPADILPTAVNTPVGIVYDADGSVTSALLGQGAGDAGSCFSNAAFGGVDNFSTDGHLLHAVVVLNGNCAQTSDQIPDVKYRLVRVVGRVLGLDWSQANVNVFTRTPAPTSGDFAGLTIMHALDPINCVPISLCFPNADQPKMDDRAAISRLYPVTAQNQPSFPGKQILSSSAVRIHGSVYFVDSNGQPAQPMQGVNVVARWIDPASGQPSGASVATSVSGFLFHGNAGNPATGFTDSTGQRFDRFGSDDPAIEGFFDLAGLEIPNGTSSAQYQLTVEPVDPTWSQLVGPYGPWQVHPSGTAQPIIVTTSLGSDTAQDILMQNSTIQEQDWFEPTSYSSPAPLPAGGNWGGSLSGSDNSDYFFFSGQNNRTLSVEVTALDESRAITESKAQPVIGMWGLSDPGTFPAPANTPLAFNTLTFGMTRLDAILQAATTFRLGIFDYRGDGRPDYRYRARVFYADNVSPARASVAGGTPLTVQGVGFRANTVAVAGTLNAAVLAASANQVILSAPAMADGVQNLALADPATRSSSAMANVLIYGAGPTDTIKLVAGSNPATPVGGEAVNPIRIRVVAADGVTPVSGASVFFTATPAVSFSACNGASSCTVLTDQSGQASTRVTPFTAGTISISAVLAPASYLSPQSVQTTLLATSSSLDISVPSPFAWIAQGATLDMPLTARVLSNGAPVSGSTVTFQVMQGSATLNPANATTNANGYATTALHVPALGASLQVSACVQPGSKPCQSFFAVAVPASSLKLEALSGGNQASTVGQNFRPVIVRATDSATPPNPVLGAVVSFQEVVFRLAPTPPVISIGGIVINPNPAPVIIASSHGSLLSDRSGLVNIQPSSGGAQGAVEIQGSASAGTSTLPFQLQSFWPLNPQVSAERLSYKSLSARRDTR